MTEIEIIIVGVCSLLFILIALVLYFALKNRKSSLADEFDPRLPLLNDDSSPALFKTLKPNKSNPDLASAQSPKVQASQALDNSADTSIDVKDEGKELILEMEVISGPSTGTKISRSSAPKFMTEDPSLSITIGRVPKNDFVIDDPEISGKHALVSFNSQTVKWQIMDRGSLNGTTLNSTLISPPDNLTSETRKAGNYVNLSNGDVIIFGTNSSVLVRIFEPPRIVTKSNYALPFVFAGVEDPMVSRKTSRNLPMQDFLLCKWPVESSNDFGIFCIFDGHGGDAAAQDAKRLFPSKISELLSQERHAKSVFQLGDSRNLLEECFELVERQLPYDYEGCTATVVAVWRKSNQNTDRTLSSIAESDPSNNFGGDTIYVQCANVGDSHCIMSLKDELKLLSKDHKVSNAEENKRLNDSGFNVRSDEKRIFGLNLARVLGDKFIKYQNVGIISVPHISEPIEVKLNSNSFLVIASDGLWDVISFNRAIQIAKEERGRKFHQEGGKNKARRIAGALLNKARACKTQDNTSVVVVDFGNV